MIWSRAALAARIPGGPDGRRMLWISLVDRVGSGLWAATSVLYFTYVCRLTVGQVGTLAAVAGLVGVAGAPIGGRLADRLPLTRLLVAFQLLRAGASLGLLAARADVALLVAFSAAAAFGDRAGNILTRLYASRVAGPERVRYQAINRSAANAGWALGGLGAAAALAVPSASVYEFLLLGDAASFLVVAVITFRCGEPAAPATQAGTGEAAATASPWRDRSYLAYVATETVLYCHDAVFNIGLPLWAVHGTTAPHGLVPLLLVVNNVMVVGLQVPLARLGATTRAARALLIRLALVFVAAGLVTAAAATGGPVPASVSLVAAAVAFTFAEMLHATVSWELSIALAPEHAQGAYLGVHGLAQAAQRTLGPLAVTAAIATGPAGWSVFGAFVAGACLAQHRLVRGGVARRTAAGQQVEAAAATPTG
ncbi:MFS transporter [Sphaerisporangium fuscum]|uniref:MFS transporter n=1 Tax=Sphaerisporangium fuscum TaxID=2835868 RepID=UPI001BDBBC09|nr:MFS transporter [Sphaerisporangium fuscum]